MIIVHLICMFLICPLSLFFPKNSYQWYFFISVTIFLKQSKNYIKFHFQFLSTLALEDSQFPLHISSEHRTVEQLQGSAYGGGLYLNTLLDCRLQVNYINQLLYPVSVSDCPRPWRVVLCILIGEIPFKRALLIWTLLSASKPNFKKRPVIGNRIKFS